MKNGMVVLVLNTDLVNFKSGIPYQGLTQPTLSFLRANFFPISFRVVC